MPIRKFHSIEEMSAPVWRKAGDPELFRTMAGLWERWRQGEAPPLETFTIIVGQSHQAYFLTA